MLTLLLGSDDFSKTQYLKVKAQEKQAETQSFGKDDDLPNLDSLLEQNLFSKAKFFILKECFEKLKATETDLEKLVATTNHIFIFQEKLDKRISLNKKLLAHKSVEAKEFNLPHGGQFNKWIENRVKELGGKIPKTVIELLAQKLGRDDFTEIKEGGKVVAIKEAINLWQTDMEIKKLISLAKVGEITTNDVNELVHLETEIDAFKITNAIADGKKTEAVDLIQKFLAYETGGDQKAGIIQLNALLAEQFRNVLICQDFLSRKISDQEIAKKTAWKSGRLYILKKIANRFQLQKVLALLNKLGALDEELKTSNVPPRVLLELILAQLF